MKINFIIILKGKFVDLIKNIFVNLSKKIIFNNILNRIESKFVIIVIKKSENMSPDTYFNKITNFPFNGLWDK